MGTTVSYLLSLIHISPYTTNENGHGPAWANSLFEDFCEFGLGMELANEKMRARLVKVMNEACLLYTSRCV